MVVQITRFVVTYILDSHSFQIISPELRSYIAVLPDNNKKTLGKIILWHSPVLILGS